MCHVVLDHVVRTFWYNIPIIYRFQKDQPHKMYLDSPYTVYWPVWLKAGKVSGSTRWSRCHVPHIIHNVNDGASKWYPSLPGLTKTTGWVMCFRIYSYGLVTTIIFLWCQSASPSMSNVTPKGRNATKSDTEYTVEVITSSFASPLDTPLASWSFNDATDGLRTADSCQTYPSKWSIRLHMMSAAPYIGKIYDAKYWMCTFYYNLYCVWIHVAITNCICTCNLCRYEYIHGNEIRNASDEVPISPWRASKPCLKRPKRHLEYRESWWQKSSFWGHWDR